MSKWLKDGLDARIAFYLPSNIRGSVMSHRKRDAAIKATMEFLVTELGGGTQIEATGSFSSNGKVVQEDVTICYAFLPAKELKKHEREINQIANALCIEFEQDSIAMEVNQDFYLFMPSKTYRKNYERYMRRAKQRGSEWGYQKWLEIAER